MTETVAVREPYKGLRPYEESDQDFFFGRDSERDVLIDKVLTNRLTLLFAATGVGKSSLLRAAVLPRLKDPRHENLDIVVYDDWVSPPLEGLKDKTLDVLRGRGHLADDAPVADLAALELVDFFQLTAVLVRPPLVVVLDQFEEFFRYQRKTEAFDPFLRQLSAAVADREAPIAVVISMREDFALELNAFKPYLPTMLFECFYRLEKLSSESAEAAIVKPVELVGFRYEEELLEALRKDLAERDDTGRFATPLAGWVDIVEPPYLQIVCSQLWEIEKDNSDKRLRYSTYRERGRAEGLLKSYVQRVLGRLSAEEMRLASLAFNFLVTRHGTKMAYTTDELAKTIGVDVKGLTGVLEKLHKARILRSLKRNDALWYELYHDLFSGIIGEWNDTYKARLRNRRIAFLGCIVLVAGFLLYAAYDIARNLTEHHFRLNLKTGISDTVELYRGDSGSTDLLGLQRFEKETEVRRPQIEPDKLFKEKPLADAYGLSGELIGYLPSEERIKAYWESGLVEKALSLANKSISENDVERSKKVVSILVSLRSPEIVDLLSDRLFDEEGIYSLKTELISGFGRVYLPEATTVLTQAVKADNSAVRSVAIASLARHRDPRTIETLLELIEDADRDVRRNAALALVQLGRSEAVAPLVESLKDANSNVYGSAVWALWQRGSSVAVAPLIESLKRAEGYVRGSAILALREHGGSAAVAPLIESLNDADIMVRGTAASALGQLGWLTAVPPLVKNLKGADSSVRGFAASALGQLGSSEAVAPLIESLNSSDSGLRGRVASALGLLGSSEAVAPLINLLENADSNVHGRAASALAQLGSSAALALLIENLKGEDSHARRSAASALGQLGRSEAVVPLIESLEDAQSDVRRAAALALGQLGRSAAVAPLIESLEDADWKVRRSAASALGQLGRSEAIAPLIESLEDADSDVRRRAVSVLGQLGFSETVVPLIERLNDTERIVRGRAASALGELGSLKAVAPLIERLDDTDTFIRTRAASALGKLGSLAAVAPLIERLDDEDRLVRRSAAEALGELRSSTASLIERLKDGNSDMCYGAASALGELGSLAAVAPLIKCLGIASWPGRREAVIALGQIGDARVKEEVSAVLRDSSEIRTVKLAAATTLLALGSDEGLSYLHSAVNSSLSSARRGVAKTLSEVPVDPSLTFELLEPLLDDPALSIKIQALKALRHAGVLQALRILHPKLADPDARIRKPVAETLAELASSESIPAIRATLARDPHDAGVNLILLKALRNIGTPEAIAALLEAVRQNEKVLGLRAYQLLGDLKAREALPWLEERLHQLVDDTRDWRSIRDSEREDFDQEEAERWAARLEAATPEWHWAFELGYAIARIDPDERGVALLSHELADVRYGAWMGLGEVGSVDLVRRLDEERNEDRSYPFRDSAYRAIDHMLRRFEVTASDDELRALKELLPAVRDRKAVCTRLEWTIRMLDKEGPLLDGDCDINWRNPSP